MTSSRLLLPVALGACLGACYTYQPLATPEPSVGSRVSVQLSDDGSRQLWARIGPNIRHLEGDVLSVDSTAFDLSVRQVENQRGVQNNWNGERVAVPREWVAGIQQRRLSPGGTGLLGGVVVVGMVALYHALGGGWFEGNAGAANPASQK